MITWMTVARSSCCYCCFLFVQISTTSQLRGATGFAGLSSISRRHSLQRRLSPSQLFQRLTTDSTEPAYTHSPLNSNNFEYNRQLQQQRLQQGYERGYERGYPPPNSYYGGAAQAPPYAGPNGAPASFFEPPLPPPPRPYPSGRVYAQPELQRQRQAPPTNPNYSKYDYNQQYGGYRGPMTPATYTPKSQSQYEVTMTPLSMSSPAGTLARSTGGSYDDNAYRAPSGSTAATTVFDECREEMTDDEKYLFDLNGYIVVRNVLSPLEVAQANAAINSHINDMVERSDPELRNTDPGSSESFAGTGPGRKELGRVLQWGYEDSNVFKSILAHPKLLPYYNTLLGKGYRMDHLPFVIAQDEGGEGTVVSAMRKLASLVNTRSNIAR